MTRAIDAAVELAALQYETHDFRVHFLEIEVAALQAQIDAQENTGVSNHNVGPPCHTGNR